MNRINWKKEIFTIPNMLSIFRLVLIPLYVSIYLNAKDSADYYLASAILAVSCLTDLIDGQIARKFQMISTVGKILDPFADKVTQFTLLVCLAIRHNVLWGVAGLVFIKEIFQLVAGIIAFKHGRMLKGAQITGKVCTTVLFVSLILMVMLPELNPAIINWIASIDGIFLLIAFGDYAYIYLRKDSKFQTIDNKKT